MTRFGTVVLAVFGAVSAACIGFGVYITKKWRVW